MERQPTGRDGGAAPGLSIVVPAFNEAQRLSRTLPLLMAYAEALPERVELIVVDDGSADGTGDAVTALAGGRDYVRVLQSPINRGKGASVRRGMLAARGEHVLFTDADLSTPVGEAARLRAALADGADVAIGSRRVGGADVRRRQRWLRGLAGRSFSLAVSLALLPGIRDSQCGFKAFRRAVARDLFGRQRLDGFAFDVEILWLARRLGYRVAEVPVTWSDDPRSHVRLLRDSAAMLADLSRIRVHALAGRYRLGPRRAPPGRAEPRP